MTSLRFYLFWKNDEICENWADKIDVLYLDEDEFG